MGISLTAINWSDSLSLLSSHGLRLVLVVVLVVVIRRISHRLIPEALDVALRINRSEAITPPSPEEQAQRLETLSHVFLRTIEVLLLVIGGLMILADIGVDIAPVLASAGVVGIALGFGAQSLVRDILSGLFILLENQFGKGDVVNIAGVGGVVEDVNLRRTVLRDLEGAVHSVPNGEIRIASNLTRGWSRVNLNISVAYSEDLDRVRDVLNRVGAELAVDPYFGPLITDPPKVLRVDAFEDSGIALKVLATTKPIKQWEVAGELRRRIKRRFDEEGIEIPFPYRVVIHKTDQPRTAPMSEVSTGVSADGEEAMSYEANRD